MGVKKKTDNIAARRARFKEILETAVKQDRFKIGDCICIDQCLSNKALQFYTAIEKKLEVHQMKAFCRSMVRNAFLIELVNDKVTSTKMEIRWSNRLQKDVRLASYDTCVAILEKLLEKIANLSDEDFLIVNLRLYFLLFCAIYNHLNCSSFPCHKPMEVYVQS